MTMEKTVGKYTALPPSSYRRNVVEVARSLLGAVLAHYSDEGFTAGIIVETEAYRGSDDPACHAARGKTPRNYVMFGPPGRAYVYFIYGNHYCFNVVTGTEGQGEAVLIRALEPLDGLELMRKRRGMGHKIINLTSGPGKLCAAMGISREHNGITVLAPPLFIASGIGVEDARVAVSTRIGIKQGRDIPWRFYLKENAFVSR